MSHNGKSGVRHAADMVTPYAMSAKDNAVQYAQQAGAYFGPRARRAAVKARTGYATQVAPRMGRAVAAAGPAKEQAAARSQAAMAALRGDISAREIRGALRRKARRQRAGRMVRRLGMLGLAAGGAYAAWKWWSGQNDQDWTMEPSPATEVNPEAEEGSKG
ncbi:DUF5324 family protein [Streptomyces radicis]|uniref:Uncharacterized protein n=1 Tax=Streptomyces radicis TaxID=1750517 RepID=A0A3A9WHT8_9ACTN|nr:DUF5324 family protein [Streptomyces radicis]RKN07266.1 hypothetical protein D7319_19540 [Streptomyces radicis]RKN26717.1 hypothetical protein D7318_05010 [Streptomyces radicis]